MSIHGNVLVVGAKSFNFDANEGRANGVVYMFLYNENTGTWEQGETLRPAKLEGKYRKYAYFGRYVMVDQQHVYVGSSRYGLYQYKHGY